MKTNENRFSLDFTKRFQSNQTLADLKGYKLIPQLKLKSVFKDHKSQS